MRATYNKEYHKITYFKLPSYDSFVGNDLLLNALTFKDTHVQILLEYNPQKSSKKYQLSRKYQLSHKSTFDMFEKKGCHKDFLHDDKSRRNLMCTFIDSNNLQGLIYMYTHLILNNDTYDEDPKSMRVRYSPIKKFTDEISIHSNRLPILDKFTSKMRKLDKKVFLRQQHKRE